MSKTEDEIRVIPDPTIMQPFGLRVITLPKSRKEQEVKPRIDGIEYDDTGESILPIMEEESNLNSNTLLEWIVTW